MSVSALRPAYKRVLLKISGESFCREGESGISMTELTSVAEQIRDVVKDGVQLAIVCGGGNILRGKQFADISEQIVPSTAHYMGMLATVINGLALQDALESVGVATRLQSAIRMEGVAEPFIRRRCLRHSVIFSREKRQRQINRRMAESPCPKRASRPVDVSRSRSSLPERCAYRARTIQSKNPTCELDHLRCKA